MRHFLILAIALSFVNAAVSENAAGADDAVVTLTNENFEKFIQDNEVALVEFYAPWCGHCQRLAPEYEAAAKELKKSNGVPLGKVDATKEEDLARKFEIMGYPTLKLFRKGKPEDYKGGRTAATIVSWLEAMTGPAVEIVDSKAAADKIVENTHVAFVGAFIEKEHAAFKTFESVANDNRVYGKYIAYFVPTAKNDVAVYRQEEGLAITHSVNKKEELEKLCKDERFPHLGPINGDNYADYFSSGMDLVWFTCSESDYKSNGDIIRTAAKQFRGKYSFVWLDTDKFKDHAQSSLGVKEFPSLVLQTKDGRYVYPENTFSDASLVVQFIRDFEGGKIKKFLMSEPIPEKNDERVKVVVGESFKDLVLQADKDVMLEVYAPWCGHCKNFEPIYNEFAEKMSNNKHLVIAKMDGTANESPVPKFEWKGFPTVFFVKAGTDSPINFSGDRTLEGLTTFVKEHSSKPLQEEVVQEEL